MRFSVATKYTPRIIATKDGKESVGVAYDAGSWFVHRSIETVGGWRVTHGSSGVAIPGVFEHLGGAVAVCIFAADLHQSDNPQETMREALVDILRWVARTQ